ncbi:MAG: hypothetical protein ACI31G_03010 [Bacilli bacterium]
MYVYAQALYMEIGMYNCYNKIVKFEIPNGDDTYQIMGEYIDANTKENTIDIYSLTPTNVQVGESVFVTDVYALMHVDYDFTSKTVNDYWYSYSSFSAVLDDEDNVIGVDVDFSNVTMLHRKNNEFFNYSKYCWD